MTEKQNYHTFTSKTLPLTFQRMRVYSIMNNKELYLVITEAFEEFLKNHQSK